MHDDEFPGQDRKPSKVEDVLLQIKDNLDSLKNTVTNLHDRLAVVSNDFVSPTKDDILKDPGKPSGDSHLLIQLYSINDSIIVEKDRIQKIISRLDI